MEFDAKLANTPEDTHLLIVGAGGGNEVMAKLEVSFDTSYQI